MAALLGLLSFVATPSRHGMAARLLLGVVLRLTLTHCCCTKVARQNHLRLGPAFLVGHSI
jgi:hypothetical protein